MRNIGTSKLGKLQTEDKLLSENEFVKLVQYRQRFPYEIEYNNISLYMKCGLSKILCLCVMILQSKITSFT